MLAQDKTATVNVKDVTVKELLKAIEAGSTYTFAYVDTDIDLTKKVTISATDKDIETIIKEVLPGVNVEFKDQKILLSNKPATSGQSAQKVAKPETPRTVTGRVIDKNGQPIIGAMVIEKGTQNGASTDIDGKYTLKVKGTPTIGIVVFCFCFDRSSRLVPSISAFSPSNLRFYISFRSFRPEFLSILYDRGIVPP